MIITNLTDLEILNDIVREKLESLSLHPFYAVAESDDITPVPYAMYRFSNESLYAGDDNERARRVTLIIELVTSGKNFRLENEIERIFETEEIDKSEDFDTTDHVFVETFSITINQKIKR